METQHGFPDIPYVINVVSFFRGLMAKLIHSLSTYETKLRDELKLRKKLKRTDWHAVYQHWGKRESEGRETGIYINGTRKPWKSAWKEIRRSGARSAIQGISITTY